MEASFPDTEVFDGLVFQRLRLWSRCCSNKWLINNRWWLLVHDTVDGSFYYDETADQNMEDAVKIAEVTNDTTLTKDDLSSTDILYNSDTVLEL